MSQKRWGRSLSAYRSVFIATTFFLLVAFVLAALIGIAVIDMAESANAIDDARALHAAQASVAALRNKLSATVSDNAIWDDAFQQLSSKEAKAWAYENWGETTVDYPLYDAAVVVTPKHAILMAYAKGAEFDPVAYFGESYGSLISAAQNSGKEPVLRFLNSANGVELVGAAAVQPFADTAPKTGSYSTLVFSKQLSPAVVDEMATTFDLPGLQLVAHPTDGNLSLKLAALDGATVAYLQWPSKRPGTTIFQNVRPYLVAAASILAIFLVAILFTGHTAATGLHRSAGRARFMATHDALSGLLNRAGLLENMEAAIDERVSGAGAMTLCLVDLDGFKDVNDAWGHAVGDELIKLVADRLRTFQSDDAFVARMGGDEFAIGWSKAGDGKMIQREILALLAPPFLIGGRTVEVGASIGMASSRGETIKSLELVRRADMALYRAKEEGRGRAVEYSEQLDADRRDIALLEEKLRQAIAAGEIRPAFQPLIDARSGAIKGVEALARWKPQTGRVSPEIFIPIAERSGLIDQLGMLILSTAIDQARQWPTIALSVNVSPLQLRNPNFAAEVISLLGVKGFEPSRLTLEITEGALISNPDQAKRAISSLRMVGVRFALDDFGTGYASIGALRQFGFDRIKIDRSLIIALNEEEDGVDVLKATISLARALHIPVTAEGVETLRQAETLRQSGCDQLQGYFLGRPMAPEDVTALLGVQLHRDPVSFNRT